MILQALYYYYNRLERENRVAPHGFMKLRIPFIIVLDKDGTFIQLEDTRLREGKKLVAREFIVPAERGRSGSNAWQVANLLWDHYGYVLGWPKSEQEKYKEMARKQHETFKSEVKKLNKAIPDDPEVEAVLKFLEKGDFSVVFSHPNWEKCKKIPGCNLSFAIQGSNHLVCQNEKVIAFINAEKGKLKTHSSVTGICMVTGDYGQLARLHPRTPIPGAKSNAKIVSFQRKMGFDSYGKEQSFNAPISEKASFAYTTALNSMLAKFSRQKIRIGDTIVVFWAEKENKIEQWFYDIFGTPEGISDAHECEAIKALFRSPESGTPPYIDDPTRFYVLGLSPNAARIAVRFWYAGTVGEVQRNIIQHFNDLTIVHRESEPEYLSIFRILVSIAVQGRADNIPPNLSGKLMEAILTGTPYPLTLLSGAVRRVRAERMVTYPRAAIIKAVLVRKARYYNIKGKEVGMALDRGNPNPGYRLGRLFAVLEKIQEEANPGINTTIRDRFYGAASSSPAVVFPQLMKLKNHHLPKISNTGRVVNFEKLIGEILSDLEDFPNHLSLEDQGRFAIGYYHQRQDFFSKD